LIREAERFKGTAQWATAAAPVSLHDRAPGGIALPQGAPSAVFVQPDVCGIILAGVHSWGQSPLEQLAPRPLLLVAGRPLLWYGLAWLEHNKLTQATVCANSDTHRLRRRLAHFDVPSIRLDFYEDVMPRGPAGCLRDAALRTRAQTFLVSDSSLVTTLDAAQLIAAHRAAHSDLTVVMTHSHGEPEPVGIYVASREAIDAVPAKGYQDIKEMMVRTLHGRGRRVVSHLVAAECTSRVTDPASYMDICGWVLARIYNGVDVIPGYLRHKAGLIHHSASVSRNARLVGPIMIGPGCVIGDGAMIVGPSILEAASNIGPRAVISCSVVWPECLIGPGAIVEHSILSGGSQVAPKLVVQDTLLLPETLESDT
jgi:NDP-sugar pyrophosphorylase family protein